ncbi:hypothetical protein SAMN05216326_13217 [Nitrosomonas marina]|uniref:Uncharacterized protein n=1 Tax=Nitrosomonas marina TaxID=917 RepID=A0A1I0F1F7_9PROT|nr:hypothetical protein [Nitrosomonas marina]SET51695.1 hypothetical protein SAMN05216326_13217 [Nitrosomonas marina]
MSMSYGSKVGANITLGGMSSDIYQVMDELLSPPLQQAVDEATDDTRDGAVKALEKAREGWQKLSYAIASGVVEHLRHNLDIQNIQTNGNVVININDDTDNGGVGHTHNLTTSSAATNVVFNQVVGTGSVD